jgi:hypothetical protein
LFPWATASVGTASANIAAMAIMRNISTSRFFSICEALVEDNNIKVLVAV